MPIYLGIPSTFRNFFILNSNFLTDTLDRNSKPLEPPNNAVNLSSARGLGARGEGSAELTVENSRFFELLATSEMNDWSEVGNASAKDTPSSHFRNNLV